MRKTRGPKAFLRSLRDAIARMEDGEVVGLNAHYEISGLGRVSTTSADGHEVDDDELPAPFDLSDSGDDTDPEGPNARRRASS